jgi:hypothetical protein
MLNIGLYALEDWVYFTSLLQIGQYHKQLGDILHKYSPINHYFYDKVYAASLFTFTPKTYVRPDMICGGTGFDLETKLPSEIQECGYNYDIYPTCKKSFMRWSYGCPNSCGFCVVHKKEGNIYPVEPKNRNPNGELISVLDNHPFANPEWKLMIKDLVSFNQPVDFSSGIRVQDFNEEQGRALQQLKLRYLHFAWDLPNENVIPQIKELAKYIPKYKQRCYTLIGNPWSTPEEDQMRVDALDEVGVLPFVMPFDKHDPYQKAFTRYINYLKVARIKKKITFKDYCVKFKLNFDSPVSH